ncbi:hypothetical protein AB6A40_011420 [Gnathostoma spinigerum]|uniref:DUF148 domain-containing protein n=1 Tax=Gnathostoma spinigerum TaxID=75299 RepID=A0ABD6EXR9_9BILA
MIIATTDIPRVRGAAENCRIKSSVFHRSNSPFVVCFPKTVFLSPRAVRPFTSHIMKLILLILAIVISVVLGQQGTPPVPPFLQGAPQNVISQFWDLVKKSGNKNDAQVQEMIETWVNGIGEPYKVRN